MSDLYRSSWNCFVCGKSSYKNPGISLHKIPGNEKQKSRWLKACNLTVCDYRDSFRLCSSHFKETCFPSMVFKRRTLITNSVPTIFTPEELEHPWFKTKMNYKNKTAVKTRGKLSNEETTQLVSPNEEDTEEESPIEEETIEESPIDENILCDPRSIFRYDNTVPLGGSIWVCNKCMRFLLSEDAFHNHQKTHCEVNERCRPNLCRRLHENTDGDDNDNNEQEKDEDDDDDDSHGEDEDDMSE